VLDAFVKLKSHLKETWLAQSTNWCTSPTLACSRTSSNMRSGTRNKIS